eukprot:scaffold28304_cov96-Isochrysis_galbana.AAC.1
MRGAGGQRQAPGGSCLSLPPRRKEAGRCRGLHEGRPYLHEAAASKVAPVGGEHDADEADQKRGARAEPAGAPLVPCGQLARPPQHEPTGETEEQGDIVRLVDALEEVGDGGVDVGRLCDLVAHEVLDLRQADGDGGAGGEARDHR